MIFSNDKKRATKLHEEGQHLSDQGKDQEAIAKYLKAIELNPEKSESFYNIGLIYKYRGEWELSFDYNKKANQLDPADEAARWNLAIAATALRKWDVARLVWMQQGLKIDDETGPIEMDFGMTPIRLNPQESAEVVWANRIDPVRARIVSVPKTSAGFNHGDIVLHDGAAVGYRHVGEAKYPVFNVLELFESSNYKTFVANVEILDEENMAELEKIFSDSSHEFEDWTSNVRILCRQCSEGDDHDHHDEDLKNEFYSNRTLGVAVFDKQDVLPFFNEWQNKTGAKLLSFDEIDNTPTTVAH